MEKMLDFATTHHDAIFQKSRSTRLCLSTECIKDEKPYKIIDLSSTHLVTSVGYLDKRVVNQLHMMSTIDSKESKQTELVQYDLSYDSERDLDSWLKVITTHLDKDVLASLLSYFTHPQQLTDLQFSTADYDDEKLPAHRTRSTSL